MDRIYEYSILIATPDDRRGEKVNIGIVVFTNEGVDCRFRHADAKLRALTGRTWEDAISGAANLLSNLRRAGIPPTDIVGEQSLLSGLIRSSSLGWFKASGEDDYQEQVSSLLAALVDIPAKAKAQRQPRIITEMAAAFRKIKLLAAPDEAIKKGRIVRNYAIAGNEGLTADFAMKNGVLHVASALDLRKQSANIDEAAYKSIVLDKARKKYKKTRTIGVYAVDPSLKKQFSENITLLSDYSHDSYNWLEAADRERLIKSLADASHVRGTLPFKQLT